MSSLLKPSQIFLGRFAHESPIKRGSALSFSWWAVLQPAPKGRKQDLLEGDFARTDDKQSRSHEPTLPEAERIERRSESWNQHTEKKELYWAVLVQE